MQRWRRRPCAPGTGLIRFKPQELANTVWAFATAGVRADLLYAAAAEAAVGRRLNDFDSQALANTVWAYATAGVRANALYAAVAEASVRSSLSGFNERTLTLLQATRGRDPYNVIGEFGERLQPSASCQHGLGVRDGRRAR
jgi:hypothetical protein